MQSAQKNGYDRSSILTGKITIPVSSCVRKNGAFDQLKIVEIICGGNVVEGIYVSYAQISEIWTDLVKDIPGEGEVSIEVKSACGENEVAPLEIIPMRIDVKIYRDVPGTCAISKILVNDMLICPASYETLNHNFTLYIKADIIHSHVCDVGSAHGNDP